MQISGEECSRQTAHSALLNKSKKAGVAGIQSKERETERIQGQRGLGPVHDHVKGAFGKFLTEE